MAEQFYSALMQIMETHPDEFNNVLYLTLCNLTYILGELSYLNEALHIQLNNHHTINHHSVNSLLYKPPESVRTFRTDIRYRRPTNANLCSNTRRGPCHNNQ